jgi:hypothetical protein
MRQRALSYEKLVLVLDLIHMKIARDVSNTAAPAGPCYFGAATVSSCLLFS